MARPFTSRRGQGRAGDYRAAATDLAEATRLGYKSFYLDLNKGYVNEQLGNVDQALLDYTAALKINPKLAYALQRRGQIYFDKRLYANSISRSDDTARNRAEELRRPYSSG